MKLRILTAAVLATLASTGALAASEGGDTWSRVAYGTPAATPVDRIVRLDPKSRWVNVGYAETVRFVAESGNGSERSFTWRFDVSPEVSSVDLSKLAPADFPSRNVRIFVSPDPLYAGG